MKYIFIENCKLPEEILIFFAESVGDNRNFTTFALALTLIHTFYFAATSNRGYLQIEIYFLQPGCRMRKLRLLCRKVLE